MFSKFICLMLLMFSASIFAEDKKLTIEMTTPEDKSTEFEVLTLEGMKKALTNHIDDQNLQSAIFWKKLNERKSLDKLTPKEATELLKVLFTKSVMAINSLAETKEIGEKSVETAKESIVPTVSSGTFEYDINVEKTKNLYDQLISDLPDPSANVFYIQADIDIDESLKWEDLGVSRAENFSGVIKDSWKKMASEHVKGFDHYVVINKDLTNLEGMNPHSVTLKWKSRLKRTYDDQDKKTAKYELSAQYVLVRTLNNESLIAFDFPLQKREFSISNPKSLSSGLASLIYNLLNSQSGKIGTTAEVARTTQINLITEFTVSNSHSLSDVFSAISWLNENMKAINLNVELKTFSNPGSILLFKSQADQAKLIELLSNNGGKMPISEQKLLLFNQTDKSFAIILKDGNN
jgi:hypothetical protein